MSAMEITTAIVLVAAWLIGSMAAGSGLRARWPYEEKFAIFFCSVLWPIWVPFTAIYQAAKYGGK